MKKINRAIFWAALLFAAFTITSCVLEDPVTKLGYGEKAETSFGFVQEAPSDVDTKSVITATGFESKFTSITYGAYSGGKLFSSAYYADAENGALNTANTSVTLEKGFTFTVYAFVNMGDLTGSLPNNESGVASIVYTIPAYNNATVSDVNTRGIPMSGYITLTPASDIQNETITLRRLLSKVTATLNCEWDGARIQSVKVYNMNSKLKPFGTSAASSAGDMLSFQEYTAGSDATTMTAVFYVPENMQGVYSGITLSGDKSRDNALVTGIAGRLTYLETVVASTGRYEGQVTYRSYLGANATSNFNIERNCHYHWTINYKSEKVDDYDNDWKHDMSGGLTVKSYSISLSPNPGAYNVGDSFTYTTTLSTITENPTASVSNSILTNGSCDQWTSSDPTVATVSSTGVVHCLKAGTTTITAKYTPAGADFSQISASATLTVSDVVTNYVEITGATSANVGTPIALTAKYHTVTNGVDDGGVDITTNASATWSRQSGPSNITVGAHTGQVSATTPGGDAVIRCTYSGVYADYNVSFASVVSYRFTVTATPSTVDMGNPITMSARFYTTTDGVEDSGVDVTSTTTFAKQSGGASVTVSGSTVNSPSAATAVIRGSYTHLGVIYIADANVTFNHVATITHTLVITGTNTANIGTSLNLVATYYTYTDGVPDSGTVVTTSATWSKTSGDSYISVGTNTGVVSATNAAGSPDTKTAVIKATYSGTTSDGFTVTFNPVINYYVEVSAAPTSANVGQTIQMSARQRRNVDGVDTYTNLSAGSVTWSPSSGTIKVNSAGQVSATAGGTQTITGTYATPGGNKSGTASVTFNDVITYDLVVTASGSTSVNVGQTVNLIATYRTFTNGSVTNSQVVSVASGASWSSTNGNHTVTKGSTYAQVTSVSPGGTGTVSCTYSGKTGSISVSFGSVLTKRLAVSASPASVVYGNTIQMSAKLYVTTDGVEDGGTTVTATWSKTSEAGSTNTVSVNSSGVVSCNTNPASSKTAVIQGSYSDGTNTYTDSKTVTFTHQEVITHSLVISGSTSANVGTNISLTAIYKTFTDGVETASQNVTSSATWGKRSGSHANVSVSAGVVSCTNASGELGAKTGIIYATYSGETAADYTVTFNPVVSYQVLVSASPTTANVGQTITMSAVLKRTVDNVVTNTNLSNNNLTWSPASGNISVNSAGQVTASNSVTTSTTQTITGTYQCPDNVNRSGSADVTFNPVSSNYVEILGTTTANVGQTISLTAKYHTITNGSDDGGVDITTNGSATWSKQSGFGQITVGAHTGAVTCTNTSGASGAKTAVIRCTYAGTYAEKTVTFNPVVTKRLAVTATPSSVEYPGTIQMSAKFYTSYDGVEDSGTTVTSSTSWSKSSEAGGTSYVSVNSSGVVSISTNPASTKSAVIEGTYMDGTTPYTNTASVSFTHKATSSATLTITGNTEANVGTNIQLTATYKTFLDGVEQTSTNVTSSATWSMVDGSNSLISVGTNTGVVSCSNPSGLAGDKLGAVIATYNGATAMQFGVTFHPVVTKVLTVTATPSSAAYNQTIQMSASLRTTTDGHNVDESVSASSVTWSAPTSGTNYSRISVNSSGVVSYVGNAAGGASGAVTGTYSGVSGSASVTFTDVVSHRLEVTSANGLTATVGQTINLIAKYYTTTNGVEDSGTDVTVNSGTTWSPASGTIHVTKGSTFAQVTASADGSQQITATYGGYSGSVTVTYSTNVVKELIVTATPSSQVKGNTIQMSAQLKTTVNGGTPTYQDISASHVAWTALSTGTAGNYSNINVDASGVVSYSGTSSGTSSRDIQGTYDGASGSVNVTFTDLVTYTFDISPSTSTGNTVGNNVSLTAKYYIVTNGVPDSGHVPSSGVSWGSSNTNMSVLPTSGSGNATVSAVTGGTTTISASYTTPGGSRSASATVTYNDVTTYVYSVVVTPSTGSLNVGAQKPATMKRIRKTYINNVYQSGSDTETDVSSSATWTSSNTGVASIVSTRYVLGVSVGTATITGSIADPNGGANLTGTILVTVYPAGFTIGGGWEGDGGTIDL